MLSARAEGDVIGLRGPFGTPWDLSRARGRDVVMIAGGLGVAPLRALVLDLISRRPDFGRATLLVGARTPDDLLFASDIEVWEQHIDVHVTVDAGPSSWQGHVGLVTTLIDAAVVDPAGTTAFICGPEVMMRFSARGLVEAGVPADQIVLSLERNMHCAIGHCGHCQLGPLFVCRDGPVLTWPDVEPLLAVTAR